MLHTDINERLNIKILATECKLMFSTALLHNLGKLKVAAYNQRPKHADVKIYQLLSSYLH